jgi:hypothetical protein
MKPLCFLTASIALCSLLSASSALADDGGNHAIIVNNTSYTLVEFYASSSDAAGWDQTQNMLAGHSLPPGGQVTVPLAFAGGSEGNCNYDLMAVLDGASQTSYHYGLNGCSGDTWTITP